jgi:hypothetical protein
MTNTTDTTQTADIKVCSNCSYWFPIGDDPENPDNPLKFGKCKRNPPTFLEKDSTTYTGFPMIVNNEWCGEHNPKQ